MKYFILEHRMRGVFVDGDHDGTEYKPRFRWSIPRTNGWKFFSDESVKREMDKWPAKVREATTVLPFDM